MPDVHLTPSKAGRLLSQEIRHLQLRLERLEHGMEEVYSEGSARLGNVAITALQELDMLAQSTEALAIYVEKLSARLDDRNTVDLSREVSAIPLRDLGRRLSGSDHEELSANPPELF